jgi:hypothetical protein
MRTRLSRSTVNPRRTIGLIAAVAALAGALTAGCSGPEPVPPSEATPAAPGVRLVAGQVAQVEDYYACLVLHGVVLLPLPSSEGLPQVDKQLTPLPLWATAHAACLSLLSTDGPGPTAERLQALRELAECVRAHGIPEYPDPDPATGGLGVDDAAAALLKANPLLAPALQACEQPDTYGPGVVGG